ncbi:MAG: Gfo/Idh/MocA family oxidoreductase [Vulcanimicrobiota bacterium]
MKQPSSPKVAVAGTGYWGQNLVRNYQALGALKTVCDINETALDAVRFAYPEVLVTPRFAEVLEAPDIQGVVIATPPAMHYSFAREALESGKDVYVEKPLTLQVEHAQELVELAREKERLLMVGHLLHYHPAFIKLKEIVASGQLGKLQYVYSNRLSLGRVRREENSLWSFAPHDISMLLALTQAMPERVSAFGANVLQETVADVTNTFLQFPGGVCGHIFVSWLHPFKEHKLIVVAEKGMAVFEDTQPWESKLALYPHLVRWEGDIPVPEKSAVQYVELEPQEPLAAECRHFLHCLETRTQPVTDGEEGLRVLKVLDLAQHSLQNQSLPQLMSPVEPDYFVHETAWVDQPCTIGSGTKIWHFSHVLKGARLGRECNLGQNVSIANDVVLGDNVKIQNNVSVYTGTTIEDNVFLGPSAVFTNITNPRAEVVRRGLYEKTLIRRGASIGANATIVCGITIGRYAFVAAGAVVAKDVPDYALMVGVPARQTGWVSRHGHQLEADAQGLMRCPESGLTYRLEEGRLRCLEIDEEAPLPSKMRVGTRSYDSLKQRDW